MKFDEHYRFRAELLRALELDLVGCSAPDEVIHDPPITRYTAGILYPSDAGNVGGQDDLDASQGYDKDSSPDPPVAMANVRYPSSMGLTFSLDSHTCSQIRVRITAGRYEQTDADAAADARAWRRVPVAPPTLQIDLLGESRDRWMPIVDGLSLFVRCRKADDQGVVPVTLVLVNKHDNPARGMRDGLAFFQPCIDVEAESQGRAPFVGRRVAQVGDHDKDLKSYQLLYRNETPIAIGHGCSVHWCRDAKERARATQVTTTFVPRYELNLSSSPYSDDDALTIQTLAEGNRKAIIASLTQFCSGYDGWIAERDPEADALPSDLRETAREHLGLCAASLKRMMHGIKVLEADDTVWTAFQLANSAMLEQRSRSAWLKKGRPTPEPDTGPHFKWYPFQLAFILLCLPGLADPESDDRDIADLLWFPTGGGKTEAYLGVIALTVFLRRLRGKDNGHGVTAIMRYTLRLLTVDQFDRASLLICCCESIRRKNREKLDLGTEPISIGLWVGSGASPNKLSKARRALDDLRQGRQIDKDNPVQLHACPWCGKQLTSRNYYIATGNPRLVITCRNDSCEFEKELPIHVVDEDVYKFHPTLIIATADKFAGLPWLEQAASIFNRDLPNVKPPELIVQDELHLISGPLGTLAGLYETAVDLLCTDGDVRPKVVASTATIRRAEQQGKGLFNRSVQQFPPPGLTASDSYYSLESSRDERGTRLYVGLMAPGASHTTLLVRTYAALLQHAKVIAGDDEIKDPYWTLVGYFNSLRVLGGARMQVQDDVKDRIALLASSGGHDPRLLDQRIELTSREPQADIPAHKEGMKVSYPSKDCLDVILATNMISVGVDIDRLGLMAVMGQPQSTSEYIQATSRVGRQYPGLVVTLFNASRSRDRSHYESFVTFHSALYRQVESTSVTPFSSRARDRGLHAVLVAMARMTVDTMRANGAAADIERVLDKLERVKEQILARVGDVDVAERAATEAQLDEILSQWRSRAQLNPKLVFNDWKNPQNSLLVSAGNAGIESEECMSTLWSLRDVDTASNLYPI